MSWGAYNIWKAERTEPFQLLPIMEVGVEGYDMGTYRVGIQTIQVTSSWNKNNRNISESRNLYISVCII